MKQGIGRSIRLFRSFLVEQTEPHVFYSELARDSADLLEQHMKLDGSTFLDVGAGPEQFALEFSARGARYFPADLDPTAPSLTFGGVAADAGRLPFGDGSMDVTFSSNLIEHVPTPTRVADELVVTLGWPRALAVALVRWEVRNW